jgi:hypothetical protein
LNQITPHYNKLTKIFSKINQAVWINHRRKQQMVFSMLGVYYIAIWIFQGNILKWDWSCLKNRRLCTEILITIDYLHRSKVKNDIIIKIW